MTRRITPISTRFGHIIPAIASLSLIASCVIISARKYFWNDELYSYFLLADQSFPHMLSAFHDKINNTPPLYFITGWIWAQFFGPGELSLRLFSCLGICAALWLVWGALRKAYGTWPSSIGVLSVFCTSDIILSQNAEARMYGLYLVLSALALVLYLRIASREECSRGLLIATFCTHAAIVNTHLFGPFYSGAILLSHLVSDGLSGRFRLKVCLTIAASWLAVLLYLPSFLIQADAGNPRTWLPTPSLWNLIEFLGLSSPALMKRSVLVLLLLAAGAHWLLSKPENEDHTGDIGNVIDGTRPARSLLILAYSLLAVPVFIWIFSRTVKPIFWERYMMPSTLGWSILLAWFSWKAMGFGAASQATGPAKSTWWGFKAYFPSLLLLALLATYPVHYAQGFRRSYIPGLNDGMFGHGELPIVVQASAQFLERRQYAPDRDRYYFILDWESAVDPASGLFGPQEYKHLDAILRNYPEKFEGHIVLSEEFLSTHDRFLVLDYAEFDKPCPSQVRGLSHARNWQGMHCPQWVERRLMGNPRYKVELLGKVYGESILLVEALR